MKIKQIRNATIVLDYGGSRFLIDPMFSDKGAYTSFPSATDNTEDNPIKDLPVSIDEIVDGVEAVILTHSHIDHWDEAAAEAIRKDIPFFVQHEGDKKLVEESGFTNVKIIPESKTFGDVELTRTETLHYATEDAKNTLIEFGFVTDVMGIVFKNQAEKTVYLAADTIWFEGVEAAIDTHHPEVIIANLGGNAFENGRLIMDDNDLKLLQQHAPEADIVATHMEAVNHWVTSKDDLLTVAKQNHFVDQLHIPEDGDTVEF